MRRPIIVGNWKMNKTREEAKQFAIAIEAYLTGNEKAEYGIAAPFTCVHKIAKHGFHLICAAENCHYETSGAFTGEVSVEMLQDLDCTACIVGHSERRIYYNETDEAVNKKVKKLLSCNMMPIMCCGETLAQFEAGETEKVIRSQVHNGLAGLDKEDAKKVVVAYEPIWAIGTGKSANTEIAQNCCHIVRDEIKSMYGEEVSEAVRVQYGGSVKPNNIKEYMAMDDIDGALIGGASLKVESFKEIIDATR